MKSNLCEKSIFDHAISRNKEKREYNSQQMGREAVKCPEHDMSVIFINHSKRLGQDRASQNSNKNKEEPQISCLYGRNGKLLITADGNTTILL